MKRSAIKKKSPRQTTLTKAAKGQVCTLQVVAVCNYDPETTVLAHLDSEMKGMAQKSPDWFAVHACSSCHSWLDLKDGSELDRLFYTQRALGRTLQRLIDQGVIEI